LSVSDNNWEESYLDETGKTESGVVETYVARVNKSPGTPIYPDKIFLLRRPSKASWTELQDWMEWKTNAAALVIELRVGGTK
jgi:hypothetical protein